MLILNQDKKNLINFEKVINTWIENEDNKFNIYSDGEILGSYKTEERAKEVLREITFAYISIKLINTNNFQLRQMIYGEDLAKCICYEMPKE